MRRVVAGFKSEGERQRRAASRAETVETLAARGVSLGGFGDSLRSQMSPATQARIAEAEAVEAYEAAKAERERSVRAQAWQERQEEAARQSAIREALEAGEDASPRALRGERLGHTTSEFIALMSARQDVEDAQLEAAKRQAMRRWEASYDAGMSGDVSAPTALQLEEGHQTQQRAARFRQKINRRVEMRQIAAEEAFERAMYERRVR
jgi:hypothetical protein